MAGSNSA